ISRVSVYLYQGSLLQEYVVWVAPLVIVAFAGAFLGRKVLKYMNEEYVRKAVLIALLLIGIRMLYVFSA
ncbi:MAG: hypothetical protein ACLFO6_08315, partial [Archaeoglobaceae archaeon]